MEVSPILFLLGAAVVPSVVIKVMEGTVIGNWDGRTSANCWLVRAVSALYVCLSVCLSFCFFGYVLQSVYLRFSLLFSNDIPVFLLSQNENKNFITIKDIRT